VPVKTSALVIAGTLAFATASEPQPPEPAAHTQPAPQPVVPEPLEYWEEPGWQPPIPPAEGDGAAAFTQWMDDGAKGYIPDTGGKGIEIPKPVVTTVDVTCERAPASTLGLSANAAIVYDTVCALFPEVTEFGGLRPGDPQDHGSGNAIDCMIDPVNGDVLAQWLIDHWDELPLKYIIWEQRISYGGAWEAMEDRGSPTQNHMDHVHISVV
jgi:hypothetical protein